MPGGQTTPVTYTKREAADLRSVALSRPDELNCPRCGMHMERLDIVEDEVSLVFEVFCPDCHRALVMRTP